MINRIYLREDFINIIINQILTPGFQAQNMLTENFKQQNGNNDELTLELFLSWLTIISYNIN